MPNNIFSSIKWSKNNQEYLTLPGKSSTTEIRELERVTSKLRIKDAEAEDAGRYACHATNAFGTSSFNIDVTIWGKGLVKTHKTQNNGNSWDFPLSSSSFLEPPPTPQNLSILDIQSRSVKIAWTVESASPAVDRLVVQWKEQTGKYVLRTQKRPIKDM